LPPDDPSAWQRQLEAWKLAGRLAWAISSVHPARSERLKAWAQDRGDAVWVVDTWQSLPLTIALEHPGRVGMDRLLNAVAARSWCQGHTDRLGVPAVIADAGTAITVDWLDETGTFRGGAIFPGLRLMAEALHQHTALLPLIEVRQPGPSVPGTSTPAAMEAGIFWAATGGIRALVEQMAGRAKSQPVCFLTGGDAGMLHASLGADFKLWPDMTLQGLRIAAEVQP
jgi:type III pantothenate kinase